MLLPYASYLRVYEAAEELTAAGVGSGVADPAVDTVATVTLAEEQHTVLTKTVASAMLPSAGDDLVGCYLLHRGGRVFACPVDLALRSWLALAAFVEGTDPASRTLFVVQDPGELAGEQFASWRQARLSASPHIRQATWGVPRTWFLLVAQQERELYDLGSGASIRFRAPMPEARRRLTSAYTLLSAMIDDTELLDELSDLSGWLDSFSADSWVEVDYAGVAGLLSDAPEDDSSAHEITMALRAIQQRDFAAAGESYRHFVERWRVVNAQERAN